MKNYYRIMLGQKSAYANECLVNSFIGADFGLKEDFKNYLPENWKEFKSYYIPLYLNNRPNKTKIAAGLACGALWTVSKGINVGDIILSPNGNGAYLVGEISSDYYYNPDGILPHRRAIKWYSKTIDRVEMSQALQYSTGSIGTVSDISKYSEEIEKLIGNESSQAFITSDQTIEDVSVFALESHLEEFLVRNWSNTELGKLYDIYEDENGTGQQYQTDDKGRIDILAISKDKKELLVVELKRGRASDIVVGQIQRYMGYVKEDLAENQVVKGVIIALEDDIRIRRALSVTNNIDFYRYQVSFKLFKN